ncbi:MAG: succinylglutamate desuccinylase/aspartoacylase family protein [Burkholderiales bacterium]|nr:succinylglutamate desuccinylase/aspartoacylase family protein [Burkholderiales bacterium]
MSLFLPFQSVQFTAIAPGKRLIITGAVHGNEVAGTHGIRRIITEIERGELTLARGRVTFVPITNPKAYALKRRNGDRNLNRNLAPADTPVEFEDHIANWLCPLLAQHDALLDLHSFQAQGRAFVMVGPQNNTGTLEPTVHGDTERDWAMRLGVKRAVDGWLGTYATGVDERRARAERAPASEGKRHDLDAKYGVGTTEYMRSTGGMALTLECGQHDDPHGPEVAYRAIRNTLALFGLTDEAVPTAATDMEGLHLGTVVDKFDRNDAFARPWQSFDALKAGDVIGTRANGEVVRAPRDGYIVFPNALAEANYEWFYLAEATTRFNLAQGA